MIRPAAVALVIHAVVCATLIGLDRASVRVGTPRLLLLPLAALIGASLVRRTMAPVQRWVVVAGAWLVVQLVHHYIVGMTATWNGTPLHGLRHGLWDLGFHILPVALAAITLARSTSLGDRLDISE